MSGDFKASCLFIIFTLTIAGALKQNCNLEDLLNRCAMVLPVLSSPEISFALTREELDRTCVELRGGIKCIENYTNVCMEKYEQMVFQKIYASIVDTVHQLCTKGDYQDRYLVHANCVKDVRQDYESCSRTYEHNLSKFGVNKLRHQSTAEDELILRGVCCSFQEYLLCSRQKVHSACGNEAAMFTDGFLKQMSVGILKNFCVVYNEEECGLTGKAPSTHYSLLLISVASIVHTLYTL